MTNPEPLTIQAAARFIQGSSEKARTVAEALKKRVDQLDKSINAYIQFQLPKTFEIKQGPLAGVPISVKDNLCTHGWETTCGSKVLKGFIPPYDATVIRKLKEAGAVIVGKCNMDEFAFGSSNESSAFGPVKNPWDLTRVPGGSSGGSAAAVSSGEAIAALGSDTGGSIRQPASFCSVVGLKPTYGRVSRYGLVAFGSSLDQIGPITKTVEDAALLLQVMAGHDPLDSTSAQEPVPHYTEKLSKQVNGLKIGLAKEHFAAGLDPDVEKAIRQAAKTYQDLGAKIVDISLPHSRFAVHVYYIVATAEASSNLGRYDGVRYGLRVPSSNLTEMYIDTRDQGFGAEAKRRILLGTFVLSAGYYDAYYLRGLKARTFFRRDFEEAFKQVDVILTPTAPTPPFKLGEKTGDPLAMYLSDLYTIPANLAGNPAISIPGGFTNRDLPIGIQLIGKPFDEATLLSTAYAFEQATDFHKKKPRI
ncbi:MAG: Asp-tRNA(Asn)/Glu-tRNA(Gln) amidotransferase GatCAB subunit A [Candidatus Omnitrophica bacterium CG11_big_fil_rev_8_21_14_0_20_45_26]|uniref:Glutamyl-tRNA(Gln) amidotransferase subunit A n=1 Tax=Candidatus Abzuiibacterium crystallinum TaxID=1974748 RepID=A0A2H0LNE6_9BACT|nr:MAG: Asp-tRNA(Asn)/Glu-tRNA(Gln) amidotransferase GatCAB subunit A [Candidatus Omnitrophica bacterium CG11_big_fil_rev_8_21_14_0_20_45_26]PIW65076.1 MAG: Asp-tRNA(Asn)/Glu-tRNA(Gln) amidotransferase GatCAB subunit A [Candidatus Omnitrophica bacterium CG12_big_fil_rev_8_21_14_0_65_45_16]